MMGRAATITWRVVLVITVALNLLLALAAGDWTISVPRPEGRSTAALVGLLALLAAGGAGSALWRLKAPARRHWALALLFLVPIAFGVAISTSVLPLWWPQGAGGRPTFGKIKPGPIDPKDVTLFGLPDAGRLRLLGVDGLRVMIRPSFGDMDYDIYLSRAGLKVPGAPKALVRVIYKGGSAREFQFDIPDEDLMVTLRAFGTRARGWRGEDGMTLDGTSVAVERVKDRKITSMETNSEPAWSPDNPAAQLRTDLLGLMLAYGPSGIFPRSYDWHVIAGEHRERPCNGLDLNTPDADGFGVGDDDCAMFKRKAAGK